MLCFVVIMQSFMMNSHEVFIHIHQGCFAGTGAIVRLPQCQWSKPDGYGKISQCITTTKHIKTKTVCIFLGIYCTFSSLQPIWYDNPVLRKNFKQISSRWRTEGTCNKRYTQYYAWLIPNEISLMIVQRKHRFNMSAFKRVLRRHTMLWISTVTLPHVCNQIVCTAR